MHKLKAVYTRYFGFITTLLLVFCTACVFQSKLRTIDAIRIEDTHFSSLFPQESDIDQIRAQWRDNRIDLVYGASNTTLTSLYLENDYLYRGRSSNNIPVSGQIISGRNFTDVQWDEVDDEGGKPSDLIFVIYPEKETENKYKGMVYIPGGSMMMGSKYQKDEQPIHKVSIDGFYIDKYEVTVAEYREFCRATRRLMPRQPGWNNDRHPVVNISWLDANAYAKWKGKRLPTEAEWEYAARSGYRGYFYSWGNRAPLRKQGGNIADEALKSEKYSWRIWKNYYDGFVYTAPIGSFYSNAFGLYDMTGNVWEWCSDWYDASYYSQSPENNPPGPEKGEHKVLRGGSWNFAPRDILTTRRLHYRADVQLDYIGFRCAMNK